MRYEYVNSFADSAHSVMSELISSRIRRGDMMLRDSISASGVSATVFLVGNVDGRVVLDLESTVARKIAGVMNHSDFERVDHLVLDTICELANIIIGKAVTLLNNKGFKFRPSPPCFFVGNKVYPGLEALCISLFTEWGEVRVQAAVRECSIQ